MIEWRFPWPTQVKPNGSKKVTANRDRRRLLCPKPDTHGYGARLFSYSVLDLVEWFLKWDGT